MSVTADMFTKFQSAALPGGKSFPWFNIKIERNSPTLGRNYPLS